MEKKKVKIAYCVVALDGGVGNLILNYLDHMPRTQYEVFIITQDESSTLYKEFYLQRGIHIFTVPSKRASLLRNLKALWKIMKNQQFDIVHAHMTLTNVFPLSIAMLCGVRTRVSHSHLDSSHSILTWMLALGGKLAATDYYSCGFDAGRFLFGKSKFCILNNALALDKYLYDETVRLQERTMLGIDDNTIVVGHVGRFTEQKNHHMVLRILKELLQNHNAVILLLIGDGELLAQIQSEAFHMGIADRIIYTGAISDVNRKLQAMDLFLLPSLFEGLPISAIEAQAAGLGCLMSENVSCFSKINNNVKFLDLDKPVSVWAQACLELAAGERITDQDKLKLCGYDINDEAQKLDSFYRTHAGK